MGDKLGVFNIMIVFTTFAGAITLALWLPTSTNAPIIVFGALYGFASGCTFSIIAALVAQISDVRELGARIGLMYAVSSIGVLVGSPIAGAIVTSQNGGFSGLKIFAGVTLLASAVFVTLSRVYQAGWSIKKKI
jgi:predicted MFS family arabinose efflux permease